MKKGMVVFTIIIMGILSLSFQNCSENFEAELSTMQNQSTLFDLKENSVFDNYRLLSKPFQVLDDQRVVVKMAFGHPLESSHSSEHGELGHSAIIVANNSEDKILDEVRGANFDSYTRTDHVKTFKIDNFFLVLVLHNSGEGLILIKTDDNGQTEVQGEIGLGQLVSELDLKESSLSQSQSGERILRIGSVEIFDLLGIKPQLQDPSTPLENPEVLEVPEEEKQIVCPSDSHVQKDRCVSNTKACLVSNGKGEQTWKNNQWSSCEVISCKSGYHKAKNSCKKNLPSQRNCSISNGRGIQNSKNNKWGLCKVASCNSGYRKVGNKCLSKKKSCSVKNGKGTKKRKSNGKFGSCRVTDCYKNFHKEGNKCRSNTRRCDIDDGRGRKKWKGKKFGSCRVTDCKKNFRKFRNMCVPKSAPTIDVNVYVNRSNKGTWNNKWTSSYLRDVTDRMTQLSHKKVVFRLKKRREIRNTEIYLKKEQKILLKSYKHLRRSGEITAIASNSKARDSFGRAYIGKYFYSPYLVFRSKRSNNPKVELNHAAKVILHELGHNMGMDHEYHKDIHIDNYYSTRPAGLVRYIHSLKQGSSSSRDDDDD